MPISGIVAAQLALEAAFGEGVNTDRSIRAIGQYGDAVLVSAVEAVVAAKEAARADATE